MLNLLAWATAMPLAILPPDSEAAPMPRATASPGGQAFVRYDFDPAARGDRSKCKVSAWHMALGGENEALWQAEGWYDFQSWLTDDGRYLVRLGPWPRGEGPEQDDLAVAFMDRGRLLRSWSTRDLVKDDAKVPRSVSHYRFVHPDHPPGFTWARARTCFRLTTVDGIQYTFDVTTGKILESEQVAPVQSRAQGESEQGLSMLLQRFYVAWGGGDWEAWAACLHERARLATCAVPAQRGDSVLATLEVADLLARPEMRLEAEGVDDRWFTAGHYRVLGDTAVAWLEAGAGGEERSAPWRGAHVLTLVRERAAWRILSITWGGHR